MKVRGPELFYSVCFKDDYGFYPARDLLAKPGWTTADCIAFAMGDRPVSLAVLTGYGLYIEHEDFWAFGRTAEEVRKVADEWPEE